MKYVFIGLVILTIIASVTTRILIVLKYYKQNQRNSVNDNLELIHTLANLKNKGIISEEEMNSMLNEYATDKNYYGDSFDDLEKLKELGLLNEDAYHEKLYNLTHLHDN